MTIVACCLSVSSLEARNVGLFYNAEYLDIMDGDLFAEASNLKSSLEYLGHNVVTFQELKNIDNIEIDVLIIPELEKLSLLGGPVGNEIGVIETYINNGGGLILMGVVAMDEPNNDNAIDLMNQLLNTNMTAGEPVINGSCTKSTNLLDGDFSESPEVINNNNAVVYLKNGFVEGVKVIYHNTEILSDVAVAQFPLGQGSIVYFGWGWWNAFPVGEQDGGWLALLDETIEILSCNGNELSLEEKYTFNINESGNFLLKTDEFKTGVKSCTEVDIQISKAKFKCDDVGLRHFVEVTASNTLGWESTVVVEIELIDSNGYCNMSSQGFSVSGQIANGKGVPMKDIVLSLNSGEIMDALVSDENGQLSSDEPISGSFVAQFGKNVNLAAGISANDVNMLNRHLLGIEEFTSPYQFIAADMNADGILNVMDELIMKRILLHSLEGSEVIAPNLQFISKSYSFRPSISPLHQNWDSIQGATIDINNHELDVIVVKLGDVDFSIK